MLLASLLMVSAVGCEWISSTSRSTAEFSDDVDIAEGQTIRLGARGPLLAFKGVLQDSRCPTGVECVWAGVAEASFRLLSPAGDSTFVLSIPGLVTTPYEAGERVAVLGRDFKLLELNPYPDDGHVVDSTEYRAVLRVDSSELSQ